MKTLGKKRIFGLILITAQENILQMLQTKKDIIIIVMSYIVIAIITIIILFGLTIVFLKLYDVITWSEVWYFAPFGVMLFNCLVGTYFFKRVL